MDANELTDRVAQVNWIRELAGNIRLYQGGNADNAAEMVEYATSDEGAESWGIDWPAWFDEHDRALLVRMVAGEA